MMSRKHIHVTVKGQTFNSCSAAVIAMKLPLKTAFEVRAAIKEHGKAIVNGITFTAAKHDATATPTKAKKGTAKKGRAEKKSSPQRHSKKAA